MTAPPIFPSFPGLAFPVVKSPGYSTDEFKGASGIRIRQSRRLSVLWTFTLDFAGLQIGDNPAYAGIGADTVKALMGMILDQLGGALVFLLKDPNDCTLSAATIGTGDGTTTDFAVTRTMRNSYAEPVGWIFASDITAVTVGGTTLSGSDWSITDPNILHLATAPAAAAAVKISTNAFYFQVTFPDTTDFSQFLDFVYEVKELKLLSVVPNYPTLNITG
jgi:hypothetical protein